MAALLTEGMSSGTTIVASMPSVFAARATACPWFPEEKVMTPDPGIFSSSTARRQAFMAPRNLKAPAFCRFSHLSQTSAFESSPIDRLLSRGVQCACAPIRFLAVSISRRSGSFRSGMEFCQSLLLRLLPGALGWRLRVRP